MPDRVYANAPIIEAVLDIRVRASIDPGLELLSGMQRGEEERYPKLKKPMSFEVHVSDLDAVPQTKTTSTQIGHTFESGDGKNLFIARRDGISIHRLRPYTSWGPFKAEAQRLWEKYVGLFKPAAVEVLLLRNINQIEVGRDEQVESVSSFYPMIPPGISQVINNYALSVDLAQDDPSLHLLISGGTAGSAKPEKLAILLDITAYKQISNPLSEEQLWGHFDVLRRLKDDAFENCITDKVREMIA